MLACKTSLSGLILLSPLLCGGLFATTGCGSDDETAVAAPPDGVKCDRAVSASDEASLVSGLEKAGANGGCVVLTGNVTVSRPLSVLDGVTLTGAKGSRPVVTSTASPATSGAIAVTGTGATVANLDVASPPEIGLGVFGRDVNINDVKVSGAKKAALVVLADPTTGASATAKLTNVILEKSSVGLYAVGNGIEVEITNGRIAENGGTSLAAGAGVVVGGGAKLDADGLNVEKNEGPGVLLDGETTRARIKTSTISENLQRGIWAQGLKGTLEAPALELQDTQVSKNRIIGVGGIQLKGIIIVGGSVKETVASPVPTSLGKTEPIGDGLGILDGSTDFKIERTNFERNDRAAGVLDGAEVGIIIVGGKVDPGDSGLKFVVQNSSKADVQIADADRTVPPQPLSISAPKIAVPKL